MASVNFPTNIGGDGSTVTDDSNATTGLANGGFRTRLLPMFTNIVNIATWMAAKVTAAASSASSASGSATAASGSATAAAQSASSAVAAAATAANSPGTSSTSTTSLSLAVGTQSLTIQTGKLLVPGMYVTIASTASPSNVMAGPVISYNSATGALSVGVTVVVGIGTFAAWTIALSGPIGPVGATGAAGSQLPYLHVREQQPSGTSGGAGLAGANTRVLNTVVTNTIAGASLASNQVTLPPGTYQVVASAPALGVTLHQLALYNATAGAVLVAGTSEATQSTYPSTSRSKVIGQFTLVSSSALSLLHYMTSNNPTAGAGAAVSRGLTEVYSELEITKIT